MRIFKFILLIGLMAQELNYQIDNLDDVIIGLNNDVDNHEDIHRTKMKIF